MELRIRFNKETQTWSVYEWEPEGYEDPIVTGASKFYALECLEKTILGLGSQIRQTQF